MRDIIFPWKQPTPYIFRLIQIILGSSFVHIINLVDHNSLGPQNLSIRRHCNKQQHSRLLSPRLYNNRKR